MTNWDKINDNTEDHALEKHEAEEIERMEKRIEGLNLKEILELDKKIKLRKKLMEAEK